MQLVTRAQWGAAAPRGDWRYVSTTQGVKVHYEGTAVPADLVDHHERCAARVRDIQASHMANTTENYMDIAYNAIVCPHGSVYEGRGLHHETGANGNQPLNLGHYAVCAMVGDSGLTQPTDAQLGGLRDAIEWFQNDGGAGPEIRGHRDGYATSCPGGPLYAWVQAGAPRPGGTVQPAPAPAPQPAGPARYQTTIAGLQYGYGAHGAQVTQVGQALVTAGFGSHYQQGPGPDWSDADTENYADYQRSLGFTGGDADGVPGEASLRRLLGGHLPGDVPAFPGPSYFAAGQSNGYVTMLGQRLVAKGYGSHYRVGPGPNWGEADRANVADFQRAQGWSGSDADGYPGPETWRRLFS